MIETKALVIGTVLKYGDVSFKASKVYNDTGLPREVTRYHLEKLCEQGFASKNGMYYEVINKNGLIQELTDLGTNTVKGLLSGPVKYLGSKWEVINNHIDTAVVYKSLKLPLVRETQENLNKELDTAIEALKGLKKYLNTKTYNGNALFEKTNEDELWSFAKEIVLSTGMTRAQWETKFEAATRELDA